MHQVFITDFWQGAPDVEQAALSGLAEVAALHADDESALLPRVVEADALLVWHHIRLTATTIQRLARCKVIVRVGVGYDNVDLAAAAERGIPVCNVPDYGTEEVADHTIAMLLSLARNLWQFQLELRAAPPVWKPRGPVRTPRLRGQTFGVIGLGRIGTATALRAKAFGMRVVAHDPYLVDGAGKALGIEMVETLGDLLRACDVVSLHTPLNDSTRNLISAAQLAQCRRGAILLNTARGPVCDTRAVCAALESGQLGGAGLDVLPHEPPALDDPLLMAARDASHPAHHRLLLSPHSAFFSEEGFEEMRRKAALEAGRALRGERVRNRVN